MSLEAWPKETQPSVLCTGRKDSVLANKLAEVRLRPLSCAQEEKSVLKGGSERSLSE